MNRPNSDPKKQMSPSMIQKFFSELKENGYSDDQISALSVGLMELARNSSEEKNGPSEMFWDNSYDLSVPIISLPEF